MLYILSFALNQFEISNLAKKKKIRPRQLEHSLPVMRKNENRTRRNGSSINLAHDDLELNVNTKTKLSIAICFIEHGSRPVKL